MGLLLFVAAGLPFAVLACLSPRTERWRRARKRFWLALLAGFTIAGASLATVNLLGPAVIWLGALFLFVTTAGVAAHAIGVIRSERRA